MNFITIIRKSLTWFSFTREKPDPMKELNERVEFIKEVISKGRIEKAIEITILLAENTEGSTEYNRNTIILLSGQFKIQKGLEQENRLSSDTINLKRNEIIKSLLDYLEEFKTDVNLYFKERELNWSEENSQVKK